jgi:hypothetical protein
LQGSFRGVRWTAELHPFVATTGKAGEFVSDGVPAGRCPIKRWREGVRLPRIIPSLQFEDEEP